MILIWIWIWIQVSNSTLLDRIRTYFCLLDDEINKR